MGKEGKKGLLSGVRMLPQKKKNPCIYHIILTDDTGYFFKTWAALFILSILEDNEKYMHSALHLFPDNCLTSHSKSTEMFGGVSG